MKTLKDTKPGETVTIVKLHGEGAVKRRIMEHRSMSERWLRWEIQSKSMCAVMSFLFAKPIALKSK